MELYTHTHTHIYIYNIYVLYIKLSFSLSLSLCLISYHNFFLESLFLVMFLSIYIICTHYQIILFYFYWFSGIKKKTEVIKGDLNPKWDQVNSCCNLSVLHSASCFYLQFEQRSSVFPLRGIFLPLELNNLLVCLLLSSKAALWTSSFPPLSSLPLLSIYLSAFLPAYLIVCQSLSLYGCLSAFLSISLHPLLLLSLCAHIHLKLHANIRVNFAYVCTPPPLWICVMSRNWFIIWLTHPFYNIVL